MLPAAAADRRPVTEEDELEDSEDDDEEEETDDLDDEEPDDDDDDDGDLDRKPPVPAPPPAPPSAVSVLNGSSFPSTSKTSGSASKIPVPVGAPPLAAPFPNPITVLKAEAPSQAAAVDLAGPPPKRQRLEAGFAAPMEEKKPLAALEDSRRLFQRLFTDEDEITILQGFLNFRSQRSGTAAHHAHNHITGPFYDQIRTRLQLDFNKNQLVEKLRRLKKKYRNMMAKMSSIKNYAFRNPHEQATFKLSHKIWGNSIYSRGAGARPDDEEDDDPTSHHQISAISEDYAALMSSADRRRMRRRVRRRAIAASSAAVEELLETPEAPVEVKVAESHIPMAMASVPSVIEETVRSCLSPIFKELLFSAVGGPCSASGVPGRLGLGPLPLNIEGNPVNLRNAAAIDGKWRKQQILELEVYSQRIQLVQEQIKLMLEELRK